MLLLLTAGCHAELPAPRVASPTTQPAPLSIEYRGVATLPDSARDQFGHPFNVVGVSGITWLGGNRYAAVLDNSDKLLRLTLDVEPDGRPQRVALEAGLRLPETHDNEGVAFNHLSGQSLFVSDEGSRTPPPGDLPRIREYRLDDGVVMGTLRTPQVFAHRRSNRGFESLAAAPDMSALWTANEEALDVDGPLSTRRQGTLVRMLRFDRAGATFTPGAQFAYAVDAIHTRPGDAAGGGYRMSCSGLSDLVALPDGRLLALERSFAYNGLLSSFLTRIYEVDTSRATDVRGMKGLAGQAFTPATKRLLYRGDLANLEGLCLGPELPGGGRLLVGVTDNNNLLANTVVTFVLRGAARP